MRKIRITKWKARTPNNGEIEESLLTALNVLLMNKRPEEMPRGVENFRFFTRISKAFDKAEESNELVLEDADYSFLKQAVEKDIPSVWGMNKDIARAIEAFLSAKEE